MLDQDAREMQHYENKITLKRSCIFLLLTSRRILVILAKHPSKHLFFEHAIQSIGDTI